MTTVRIRTFRSGNSEAVRLPKEVAFGNAVEVTIIRSGDVMTIYPAPPSMAELIAELEAMDKPPYVEVRDEEEIDDRPGL